MNTGWKFLPKHIRFPNRKLYIKFVKMLQEYCLGNSANNHGILHLYITKKSVDKLICSLQVNIRVMNLYHIQNRGVPWSDYSMECVKSKPSSKIGDNASFIERTTYISHNPLYTTFWRNRFFTIKSYISYCLNIQKIR